ncbi:MFS transporter [Saccharopolyspora sp. NPDC000995]
MSSASGLPLPNWAVAALSSVAVVTAVGFGIRQHYASTPLIDRAMLHQPTVRTGLLGALCGYLVLFGPLVLVPLVLHDQGTPEAVSGLVLTALPAGFALAATTGRALPRAMTDRHTCLAGCVVCVVALATLLVVPLTVGWLVPLLVLLGLGLGVFTPANNTVIMKAIPARTAGTGGGLVNMARGLGTTLGVSLVTLSLNADAVGARLAVLILLVATVAATLTAARPTSEPQ